MGDEVQVNAISLEVIGISDQMLNRIQYVSLEQSRRVLGRAPNSLLLNVDAANEDALLEKRSESDGYYGTVFKHLQYAANLDDFQSLDVGAWIIAVFASVVALLILYNMSMITLNEKKYDYCILMSMGYTPFDEALHTMISYNGGQSTYPPGLNPEMVENFRQKPDSALLVYRLRATPNQKKEILEKIREINNEGSAYNFLGLFFKISIKPNIMFCSQFVFSVLEKVGLDYFTVDHKRISPSDFVEQDRFCRLEYLRKL